MTNLRTLWDTIGFPRFPLRHAFWYVVGAITVLNVVGYAGMGRWGDLPGAGLTLASWVVCGWILNLGPFRKH